MFKRQEDQKWRTTIDHQIVSLLTSQQVLDQRLDDIEAVLKDLDSILRGDPKSELDGLVPQIHQMWTEVRQLKAVIFVDSTGKGGLIKEVEELRGGREDRRLSWSNATKIAVAVITSGSLGLFWRDIRAFVQKKTVLSPAPVAVKSSLAHRRHMVREVAEGANAENRE